MLQVLNVSKSFKQGSKLIEVLKDCSLEVEKGSSVGLLGKSGSGKSTFLSLLAGLEAPDQGEILLDQININKLAQSELVHFRGKKIGFIFQNFNLIPSLTAFENIALPLEIQKEENVNSRVMDQLDSVGLKDRMNHFPHQLSGGECQRVAIARALVHGPAYVFADEPSGSLDVETGDSITNLLFKKIKESQTSMIVVTHSLDLAKQCDRVFEMVNGKLEQK